jgi:hypothetical protein
MFGLLYSRGMRRSWLALGLLSAFGLGQAQAERPPAPRLLPEATLAYVRVHDARELKEALDRSSFGRLGREPQIEALVRQLYGSASKAFQVVEQQIGLSLDEVLAIPQGELAIAVFVPADAAKRQEEAQKQAEKEVASESSAKPEQDEAGGAEATEPRDESPEAIRRRIERRRRQQMGPPVDVVVLVEAKEQVPLLMSLLEKAEQEQVNRNWERKEVEVRGTPIISLTRGSQGAGLTYGERDGVVMIGSRLAALEEVLGRWDGTIKTPSLSQNRDFLTVMNRCVGAEETRPQMTFFVNPPVLLSKAFVGISGAAITNIWKSLGADGIRGAGGSYFLGGDEFEGVIHAHLALEGDRTGVLALLQAKPTELQPEAWVPENVSSYTTLSWDFAKTLDAVQRIVDRFLGNGSFEKQVLAGFNTQVGLDLRKDLIDQISGRVTMITSVERPIRFNSQTTFIAVELKEGHDMQQKIEKIVNRIRPGLTAETVAGGQVYQLAEMSIDRMRTQTPTIALHDRYLIYCDSRELLEQVMYAMGGGSETSLRDSKQYQTVTDLVKKQLGESEPVMFSYSRPEESLRMFYEMANDPDNRKWLEELSQQNPFFLALYEALRDNPLPPFSVIERHLAPGGAFVYDESTGFHYMAFSLQPASAKEDK